MDYNIVIKHQYETTILDYMMTLLLDYNIHVADIVYGYCHLMILPSGNLT